MAKLCALASSSSGNSVYIENDGDAILVDAGTNCKTLISVMEMNELECSKIRAIFITHTHSDHISALKVLSKKLNVPVFASEPTLKALADGDRVAPACRLIKAGAEKLSFANYTYFSTSHDALGSMGYTFDFGNKKIAVCTDLGVVSDEVRSNLASSDIVYFESNHDITKLQNNPNYPPVLKQRILGPMGHLSNGASAAELPALIKSGTKKIVLAHLSKENNLPSLAHSAATASLMDIGAEEDRDYMLYISKPLGNKVVFF